MKKFSIRSLIIIFWVALIFGCLYWPKLKFLKYDSRTINVFAWGNLLDPDVIKQFEAETNIKINLSYYSSNEELLVKLKATKGEGYDLIMPSDYAVKVLIEDDLLKPLDKSKLKFWHEINPSLLNKPYDPENHFSIPFEWEVFVFGIDKDYFAHHPLNPSWKLIFDKSIINYKIAMTNDPIEAILFAGFYLYGNVPELSPSEALAVKNLLIAQKSWVEAYASFRGDYFLATKNCPVVIASTSYISRTMKQFPFVSFVVPKEGSFITIETIAIPALSEKEELTYQFINYLFNHDSIKSHYEKFGVFPSTLQAVENVELGPEEKALINATEEQFKKFYFITEILPQQQIHDMWVEVKSGRY